MYDTNTALIEITRRSEEIKRKKSAGMTVLLTSVSGALALALCLILSVFVNTASVSTIFAQYGALMLDELAGGYVLSAVAGFSIASGITVGIYNHKNK
jgi:hypothetical protein